MSEQTESERQQVATSVLLYFTDFVCDILLSVACMHVCMNDSGGPLKLNCPLGSIKMSELN